MYSAHRNFTGASKCAEFLAIFILPKNWSSQKKRPKKTRRKNRRSGLRKPPTTQQKPISKILIRRCRRHGSSQPTRQKRKNSTNKLALRLMPLRAGRRRRCPPSLIPNLRPTTKAQPRIRSNSGPKHEQRGKICSSNRSKIDVIGRFGRRSCWAKFRLRKKISQRRRNGFSAPASSPKPDLPIR